MRWNLTVRRYDVFAILLRKFATRVGVERVVKRLDLLPQPLHFSGESVGCHIVLGAPHRSSVLETHFDRALVTQFDKALIVFSIGYRNLVPAEPDTFQL